MYGRGDDERLSPPSLPNLLGRLSSLPPSLRFVYGRGDDERLSPLSLPNLLGRLSSLPPSLRFVYGRGEDERLSSLPPSLFLNPPLAGDEPKPGLLAPKAGLSPLLNPVLKFDFFAPEPPVGALRLPLLPPSLYGFFLNPIYFL